MLENQIHNNMVLDENDIIIIIDLFTNIFHEKKKIEISRQQVASASAEVVRCMEKRNLLFHFET